MKERSFVSSKKIRISILNRSPQYQDFPLVSHSLNTDPIDLSRAIRIWPHITTGEGHFIARMKKTGTDLKTDIPNKYSNNPIDPEQMLIYEEFFENNLVLNQQDQRDFARRSGIGCIREPALLDRNRISSFRRVKNSPLGLVDGHFPVRSIYSQSCTGSRYQTGRRPKSVRIFDRRTRFSSLSAGIPY